MNIKLQNIKAFSAVIKTFIFITLFCFTTHFIYGENIEVRPENIKFNWESGNADDALAICDDDGSLIEEPEWKNDGTIPLNCAYVMGQSNRQIQVQFSSPNYQGNMHLIINLTVSNDDGIGTICNFFVSNYTSYYYVKLPLTGSLPESVGKHEFTWHWDIYAIPTEITSLCAAHTPTTDTHHIYYTLLDIPKAPMEQPWSSVLNKACDWANGQLESGVIAKKIVEELYNNAGFRYDVVNGTTRYTGMNTAPFNLNRMMTEIGSSDIIVSCHDVAKAVTIFINSLGINSSYMSCSKFGYVNCIVPIGRDWTNNPFYSYNYYYHDMYISTLSILPEDAGPVEGRSYFYNHGFCSLDGIIYDACLKINSTTNPDASPYTEAWANIWDWNFYKDKVIDTVPFPPSGTSEPIPYNFIVY